VAGYDLARALALTGDRSGALNVLKTVKPARREDAASWFGLGQLAQQLRDPRLAADYYREAVRAAPRAVEPREQLGLMLVLAGDVEGAVAELEAAATVDPSDATVRLNLAAAYASLGRDAEARIQAQEALRLDPDYSKAADLLRALSK
jgi:Flp pilus assembly protein TadD